MPALFNHNISSTTGVISFSFESSWIFDFSISVVMQLSHCLKRRTSVNHLYQATSLVVSPANHSAYECLQAVRFMLLSHFCGFNQNQFIYILVVKGDFSVEFTKTRKLPSKTFHILISIDNSMVYYTFYSCEPDNLAFTCWKSWLLNGHLLSSGIFCLRFASAFENFGGQLLKSLWTQCWNPIS